MSEPAERSPIRAGDFEAPGAFKAAFHCPSCGVYAPQEWWRMRYGSIQMMHAAARPSHVVRSECFNCAGQTFWLTPDAETDDPSILAQMLFPEGGGQAPAPHLDFPADARADYEEARAIVDRSPRGSAALLRLALQKLLKDVGQKGKRIDDDIAALVAGGLSIQIQQALDALRVIGNQAVHPGTMDLEDDRDTATALFGVLNYIVDQMIAQPKRLSALYSSLPATAVAAIDRRDGK